MIVKMIKNLENKMEKMQESINKDVEELKEKAMAPHSSTLAWKISCAVTFTPQCRLLSLQWSHVCIGKIPWRREWEFTHSTTLAWRIPWTEEPAGL